MSPTNSPLAVFLKVPMVAMLISFPCPETVPFMASMAWDMTGTAADAAEGPQAQLEDGTARLFCSARNVGEAGRGKKPRTAVAAPSGRGKAAFGHQAFRRGREGHGLARVKETG